MTATGQAVDRQAIHAYLSEDIHAAWHRFAEETGTSVSGLLQAKGEQLLHDMENDPEGFEASHLAWIKRARRIDADRRRR